MNQLRRGSKRQRIKDSIVKWIRDQKLNPGDPILSQNQLAKRFKVTAVTVHKALTELVDDGVVHRKQGSGTFVGPDPDKCATRSVCLILQGEHLDQPEYNPLYWPYVQRLYRAFMDALGHNWTFTTRGIQPETPPAEAASELQQHAIAFFFHSRQPRPLIDYLVGRKVMPVALFGLPEKGLDCLTIDHDMVTGTRKAVRHLKELGYRRIAFVGSRYEWGAGWVKGFRQGLQENKLDLNEKLILQSDEGREAAAQTVAAVLEQGDRQFDVILTDCDMRALGAIDALRAAGLRVPADVGVMGYDGLDLATHHPPYLTSVKIPYKQMIQAALDELIRNGGQPFKKKHLAFVGEITPGRTCRKGSQA